ncbi:MAG: bifunctional serine/threonine-protein kinase/ABC transporter substrate-binding protein [Crocosphaera sp.]|nr:bifunctional serine/threonine-protein kinase/ABC transporter substrate-binding protein [Crocosphaera sp.]
MYFTIGQTIKNGDNIYELIEELGSGGYGTTYLVHEHNFNRQVVIKHIEPHTITSNVINKCQDIFEKEIFSLQQLGQHPQIPCLYNYFILENNFFLVQEFIDGHNFNQEIKPGNHWTDNQLITFLIEVLEILSFVHQQGIIHQDIKPSNLMRRKSDQKIFLIDFGATQEISILGEDDRGLIKPMFPVGTLNYMSPEQKHGSPRPGSDIYSLGIVAIQAITGLKPEAISQLIDTPSLLSLLKGNGMSSALISLLTKMVSFHFNQRYQNADEVLTDIKKIVSKNSLISHFKDLVFNFGIPLGIVIIAALVINNNGVKYDLLGKGDLLSVGEDRLLPNNPWRKDLGIKAIQAQNYEEAIKNFKKSFHEEIKDPETLIYLNNAFLEYHNLDYYTLAVTIPTNKNYQNTDLPQSILRGVAQAQTEVNLGLFKQDHLRLQDLPGYNFIQGKAINNKIGLKIVIANEGNQETQAQEVAKSLIKQPILGLIGSWTSDMTVATVDIYKQNKLVSISPGATTEYLTKNPSPFFFRTVTNNSANFKEITKELIKRNKTKAVFFYNPKSDFSSSAWELFKQEFEAQGGTIIHKNANKSPEYNLSSDDFNPEKSLKKIINEPKYEEEKTVIFLVPDAEVTGATENSIRFIEALPDNNQIPVVGLWSLYKDEILKTNNKTALSNIILSSFLYPFDPKSNNKHFSANSQQLWREENQPVTTKITPRTASAYDATRAFIEALEQQSQPRRLMFFEIPQKATRQGIQKTLADPNFKAQGSTASIEFNRSENGDRKNTPTSIIHIVKCGNHYEFIPIEFDDPKDVGLKCP